MINSAELRARLTLCALPGLTDRKINTLIREHGSAAAALCSPAHLIALGAKCLADEHIRARVTECERTIEKLGIRVLCADERGYPRRLRKRLNDNRPPMLFVLGDAGILNDVGIAVVGSRTMSDYGRRAAEELSRDLARAGLTVISGLARGIDGAAHQAALETHGKTIAVVGNGVDLTYPPSNRMLRRRIIEQGIVVSQFLPGSRPLQHHFPERNLIMAMLSEGVLVIEARARSGATITVNHAIDFGLDAMAVPGPIFQASCAGSNQLIRDGAECVTCVSDILRSMDRPGRAETLARQLARNEEAHPDRVSRRTGRGSDARDTTAAPADDLAPHHVTQIRAALRGGIRHLDELTAQTGINASVLLPALLQLELAGVVRQHDGRFELRTIATA
jgi:DNA processing protein